MIDLTELNDELFYIEHLGLDENTDCFTVNNPKGKGLESYFRKYAIRDEEENIARTYVIKDNSSKEIVAYFTLRSGLITVSRGFLKGFDAITGIELANFAVNDSYREVHDVIPRLGSYIFYTFILPLGVAEDLDNLGEILMDTNKILNPFYSYQYAFHTQEALSYIGRKTYEIIKEA